ncbi:MAG: DNA-directed RNA polymerase subunit beta [Gammaproteobacteria bacterium]
MVYSFAERKRLRKNFGSLKSVPIPYLLEGQLQPYAKFLQTPKEQGSAAVERGLEAVLKSIFPIQNRTRTAVMEYVSYRLEDPIYDPDECRMYATIYAASLRVKVRLVFYHPSTAKNKDPHKIKDVKEQEIFLGEIPLMTDRSSFIINGTERVIVSQLRRSPGIVFDSDRGRSHAQGKPLYTARIVPHRGPWLDFEFDIRDILHVRIDRKRKVPATVFLHALGYTDEEILGFFYDSNVYKLSKDGANFDLKLDLDQLTGQEFRITVEDKKGNVLVEAGRRVSGNHIRRLKKAGIEQLKVSADYLLDERLAKDLVDASTGELLALANDRITQEIVDDIVAHKIKQVETLRFNDVNRLPFMSDTLALDDVRTQDDALVEIYRIMRPGEPTTVVQVKQFFRFLFFDAANYDLASVGRMKIDLRLGQGAGDADRPKTKRILEKEDVVKALQKLMAIRNGKEQIDDIDHLGNRRVRTAGEMVADQLRTGLARVEKVVAERLGSFEAQELTPQDLVNSKPVSAAIREFFNGNQLSQFMDQNNPLSEIAHKRRLSAMGVGGLTRERAGYEVRDVHSSHYGRLCPIETPEGPNIGLISSLACYAKVNEYGFIETPYRKVEDGKVTDDIVYLSPLAEHDKVIAQASAQIDKNSKLAEELVPVRYGQEFTMRAPQEVQFMDISPQQIVSVAAALIPFVEHNDANRALMGSNMQRQAIPTLVSEKPLVGTGLEAQVARDSGACVLARRKGSVSQVDAERIVVRVHVDTSKTGGEAGADIYNLCKYQRTNQDTCSNQRPLVQVGDQVEIGDVLADGSSVDKGELALGCNVRAAFLAWNGYNFEDSILISEKLAHSDAFTSIHIKQLTCIARETRLGEEEITADIPTVSDAQLAKIDESGIVHLGAEVEPGDILVGRVTPKNETQLSPEERLLKTVFGDKASQVKDTSLYVPHGAKGTIIDVQILTRPGTEKNPRTVDIESAQMSKLRKNLDDRLEILSQALSEHAKAQLLGQTIVKASGYQEGTVITEEMLDQAVAGKLFNFRVEKESVNKFLASSKKALKKHRDVADGTFRDREEKLQRGETLAPGVIRIVKVFLAIRRRLQPGDKMAGRHGNKGVISAIMPIEDMPYDENGEPVDIVLNPLGIPSRMNIGQIFEAHLGWALRKLGENVGRMLDEKKSTEDIRRYLHEIYEVAGTEPARLEELNDSEVLEMADNLRSGIPIATPAFDGASEEQVRQMLRLAGLPEDGRVTLYDGRTGDAFDHKVTIGQVYMLKLNHLVEDKVHARSTGSYSLVTQQPLGGKAQLGGQRFGEMEVWALKAYGAAHTLREMLTVKSDDIQGRAAIYRNIINGNYRLDSEIPESFNVLVNEMRALGIDLSLEI